MKNVKVKLGGLFSWGSAEEIEYGTKDYKAVKPFEIMRMISEGGRFNVTTRLTGMPVQVGDRIRITLSQHIPYPDKVERLFLNDVLVHREDTFYIRDGESEYKIDKIYLYLEEVGAE